MLTRFLTRTLTPAYAALCPAHIRYSSILILVLVNEKPKVHFGDTKIDLRLDEMKNQRSMLRLRLTLPAIQNEKPKVHFGDSKGPKTSASTCQWALCFVDLACAYAVLTHALRPAYVFGYILFIFVLNAFLFLFLQYCMTCICWCSFFLSRQLTHHPLI